MMSFSWHTASLVLVVIAISTHAFLIEHHTGPLRIASFNIRHFGRGVMDDRATVFHLVKIFERYDIVLVQEVRDGTNTALDDFKDSLIKTSDMVWNYQASAPIGRGKYYQEQYAFFYKPISITYKGNHQVNDSASDVYEREPFAFEFEYTSYSQNVRQRVALMALHTKPYDTKNELIHLPSTIKTVASLFPNTNGVITMGDMNADCVYLAGKWRKSLEIFTSTDFRSLIPDSADTTVSDTTDCAYDRVIVFGSHIDVRNATVFNFEDHFQLLNKTEAFSVSDHYPVEFLLY